MSTDKEFSRESQLHTFVWLSKNTGMTWSDFQALPLSDIKAFCSVMRDMGG